MTDVDRAFHDSMKPSWGPDGILVYAVPPNAKSFGRSSRRTRERDGLLIVQKGGVVSESRDVRFAKFSNEVSSLCQISSGTTTDIDPGRRRLSPKAKGDEFNRCRLRCTYGETPRKVLLFGLF
jgi:hypothetical protein